MPNRDMEAQETGWSLPSGACKARDPPATLCFLLTLALARGILESIRLCCSYGKAWRNHVIWSLAQTLAGLICQVSGPTCQWAGRVTDPYVLPPWGLYLCGMSLLLSSSSMPGGGWRPRAEARGQRVWGEQPEPGTAWKQGSPSLNHLCLLY